MNKQLHNHVEECLYGRSRSRCRHYVAVFRTAKSASALAYMEHTPTQTNWFSSIHYDRNNISNSFFRRKIEHDKILPSSTLQVDCIFENVFSTWLQPRKQTRSLSSHARLARSRSKTGPRLCWSMVSSFGHFVQSRIFCLTSALDNQASLLTW